MKWILWCFLGFLALCSCHKDQELAPYDTTQSFIYFGQPILYGETLDYPLDSLYFSFATVADNPASVTMAIPLRTIGQKYSKDRRFELRVKETETSIDRDLWYISAPIIRANRFEDTLYLTLKNDVVLQDCVQTLTLDLIEDDEFKLGKVGQTSCRFIITDQLLEPAWWTEWAVFLGPFRQQVFRKWIELYQPGVDPTLPFSDDDKPGFYWDNMPSVAVKERYPVTFMYIELLKLYFEEHVVYPGGDMTRPRILLP